MRPEGRARSAVVAASALLCAGAVGPVGAGSTSGTWRGEVLGGDFWAVPAPLRLRQQGQPEIRVSHAQYAGRSFETPWYYAVRARLWRGDRAWEFEMIHAKLYLREPPQEVSSFSVSHGYNIFSLNRVQERGAWVVRWGGGVVVAHPESSVRGQSFDETGGWAGRGYFVAGPWGQASVQRRIALRRRLCLSAEVKATLSWARVPIAKGHAELWLPALHGLLGLTWTF